VSRVQLACGWPTGKPHAFYTKLFGVEPAKRSRLRQLRRRRATLKLVLLEGESGQETVLITWRRGRIHRAVRRSHERLSALGLFTDWRTTPPAATPYRTRSGTRTSREPWRSTSSSRLRTARRRRGSLLHLIRRRPLRRRLVTPASTTTTRLGAVFLLQAAPRLVVENGGSGPAW